MRISDWGSDVCSSVLGATLQKGVRFESCARIADHSFNWQLTLSSETQTVQHRARYLVDCSGRRGVVARALGIPLVHNDDRLFAYAQWFSCTGEDDDRYTRIEAAPQGWWYSRSEEHTSELQSLMRISYAVFCLKKKKKQSCKTMT